MVIRMPKISLAILLPQIFYFGCDIPEDKIPSYNPRIEIAAYNLEGGELYYTSYEFGTLDSSIVNSYDNLEFILSFSINFYNSEYINDPNINFNIQIAVNDEQILEFTIFELEDNQANYTKTITIPSQDDLFNTHELMISHTSEVHEEWELENLVLNVYGKFDN